MKRSLFYLCGYYYSSLRFDKIWHFKYHKNSFGIRLIERHKKGSAFRVYGYRPNTDVVFFKYFNRFGECFYESELHLSTRKRYTYAKIGSSLINKWEDL